MGGEPVRKKKKVGLKSIKKKAWKEFSRYIRMRFADERGLVKCCTCGTLKHWKEMQAGHFIPGRCNSILFDERGCHAQCRRCNFNEGNGPEYYPFMLKEYGKEIIDELRNNRHKAVKFTQSEMISIYEKYKKKARKLEDGIAA